MAVLYSEAYNAGYNAGALKGANYDNDWAAFTAQFGSLPIQLEIEFKKGFSSALSYRMDSY